MSNQPLVITASHDDGGLIPEYGGVKANRGNDKEFTVRATVFNQQESNALRVFSDDMSAWILKEAPAYYPQGTLITEKNIMRLYSNPTKKSEQGDEFWPSSIRTKAKSMDLVSSDSRLNPDLVLTTDTDEKMTIIPHLAGMRWIELKIELSGILFGWQEDKETKLNVPMISAVSRLRRAKVKEDPEQCHYVFPHQEHEHDPQTCVRKHHFATLIQNTRIGSPTDYIVSSLVKSGMTRTARIMRTGGSRVLIRINGGGTFPIYAINENSHKQMTITFTVSDPDDVNHCVEFAKDINDKIILPQRAVYYPDSDGMPVERFLKPLLKRQTKAALEKESDRSIGCIFDHKGLGTSVIIVDENNNMILDATQLLNRKWETVIFSVLSLYSNSTGNGMYECGLTKRMVFAKLLPDVESYDIA